MGITGMDEQPIKEIDFTLRTQAFIDAINADLNYASSNMGLGTNWFKFNGSGLKTATEVMSENSEAFRTKVHYDLIVNDIMYDLAKVICEMAGIQTKDIKIEPDDSIIEDKQTEIMKAQQELQMGLLSKMSYLMKYKGMTEEEATEELAKVQEEAQAAQAMQGMMAPEEEQEEEGEEEEPENGDEENPEKPLEDDEDKKIDNKKQKQGNLSKDEKKDLKNQLKGKGLNNA